MAADSPRSDLLQGTPDVLILNILAQRLQQISADVLQVQQGSLYPALHRLEKRKWVRAEWAASETGRDARFYTLTREGRRQLEDQRANWMRLSTAVTAVLTTGD